MIETTRPMSAGRAPTSIGEVTIVADGGIYPTTITNREVAFPYYPMEAKGYISEGYGIDLSIPSSATFYFNGHAFVNTLPAYDQRTVTAGSDTWEYLTPKFTINVVQGDVVHKPWIGVVITLTADQTTNVYDFVFPGPEVLVSSTSTPQTFTYTFSAADDPTVGSPDYSPVNQTLKVVAGTEYLYSSIVYTSATDYTRTETIPTGFLAPALVWHVTATTPP
jgi:hypothetical protein